MLMILGSTLQVFGGAQAGLLHIFFTNDSRRPDNASGSSGQDGPMKKIPYLLGLALAFFTCAACGETLKLQVEPDQRAVWIDGSREVVVKIDLTAPPGAKGRRLPLNLVAVLDRSGSMEGAKMEKAKQAAAGLVDQLAGGDVFALVAYDSTVQVLVPAQPIEDKERLKARILALRPGGSTALYEGVERGAAQLERYFSRNKINRVILLSDGLANVGPSSEEDLRDLGKRLSRRGLAVSTIGVGDDYNEDLMAGLAEASDANYYYVKDAERLPEIFAKELGRLLAITARDVRIEITCPKGVRPLGLIGRPEKFSNGKTVVELSPLASSQNRYVFLKCQIESGEARDVEVAEVNISYVDEVDGGKSRSFRQNAKVELTRDKARVSAAVNPQVVAERELLYNALAKDEAVQMADGGNTQEAARRLREQSKKMAATAAAAPTDTRPEIQKEANDLDARAGALEKGDYTPSMRKMMRSEAYEKKNSK
jgi:Ca-activated chloride channel family protein